MRTASRIRRTLASLALAALLLAGLPLPAFFAATSGCAMGKCACCRRHKTGGAGWAGMPRCTPCVGFNATTSSPVTPPPALAGFRTPAGVRALGSLAVPVSACARRFRQLDERPPPSPSC